MRLPHPWPVLPAALLISLGVLAGFLSSTPNPGFGRASPVSAQSSGGFVSETVVEGLSRPTDFAFAPDGRIFIAAQDGAVWIFKNGVLLPTPFIKLTVNYEFHRGLVGLALDPNFDTNGYVYLYYTYENNLADPQGPKTGRLIRVTADGDVALPGSEIVLLGSVVGDPSQPSCEDFLMGTDCIPADGLAHIGGALRFASDGKLFVATGDAAGNIANAAQLMPRSQNLDSLAGKILLLNPDGGAPADNPFFTGDPGANRSKVWAYGFRNPFRLGLQPGTDLPFIGDVGSAYWEEIDVGYPGANFGWPCYEGLDQHPEQSALLFCQDFYTSGITVAHPLYSYPASFVASVTAGVFYEGTTYPVEFQNAVFFGDWARSSVSILRVDPNNDLLPDSVETILSDAGSPLDFELGPDGDVYYLAGGGFFSIIGDLRRIRFVPGNRPPVARASATPLGGLAPLTVEFSSEGSRDPDGHSISFAWDFGDGTTSTDSNPTYTFTQNGTYPVTLTVADSEGATAGATVSIVVVNRPPRATISAPPLGTRYHAGEVIAFAGSGADAEDGTIAPPDLRWRILLHHCHPTTVGCHSHPFLEMSGVGGTLVAPNQGDEIMYLEIQLTVTDSAGLTDTVSVQIGPDTDGDGLLDFEEVLTFGTDYGDSDTDRDGCGDGEELGNNERTGGRRDPLNPWDYFNPTKDGANRSGDILVVLNHYQHDEGEPPHPGHPGHNGYSTNYDRTLLGPNAWNLGPPNAIIRSDDILHVMVSYGHDCA